MSAPSALVEEIRALGLPPGCLCFTHSALSRLGRVEGGADSVRDALLEGLGPGATLAVPTFGSFFLEGRRQVWDRERSPSRMGALTESGRLHPNARRSEHPSHPIAALGPLAEPLTVGHRGSPFGPDGPLARLLSLDAVILLLGVGWEAATLLHLVEERQAVPYRRWRSLRGTVIVDGIGKQVSLPFYGMKPWWTNAFPRAGALLEAEGIAHLGRVGAASVRWVRARELVARIEVEVARDPCFLARRRDLRDLRRVLRQLSPGPA